ncbi:MAG TPA: metalloregulator ArsR/SmtB family transcription factor [Burkholderiaceae bacterium]
MSADTLNNLLYLLKTRGPLTAQQLAEILELTSMGARRQLESAQASGLVQCEDRSAGVGRPGRWWSLTDAGHGRFPDRHGEVVVQLIGHLRTQFGEAGVESLIQAREAEMAAQYGAAIAKAKTLKSKLVALAEIRSREGYMAEVAADEEGWLLVEHHCPICAAASQCMAFCRSELQLFRALLPEAQVERAEHLLADGARCIYQVRPLRA